MRRCRCRSKRPTCAGASRAASCQASIRKRRRRPGWSIAWRAAASARCRALVDISNYVMFEYGRPSHIFDLDKIHNGLSVRWARAGEKLELLNGSTVDLDPAVGVIADDQAVESLAGVMGGAATAVSDDTRNVYVEAAFWWPDAVAGRARRYGFSTDAGHRFERGVDPAGTVEHIERITKLIVEICGGSATRCGPIDDQVVNLPKRAPGHAAGRTCRQGHRHGADRRAMRSGDAQARPAVHTPGRSAGGDAAELALRSADRGRPDRRGHPRARLRHAAGPAAARLADAARPEREPTRGRCVARADRGHRLSRDGELQLRRGTPGSATSPATPIRSAC